MATVDLLLDNGLNAVLDPRPNAQTVAISAWVGAGTADEPADRGGLAHAVEHMLFKGTERRGVGEVASLVEGAGGDINAWTSFDNVVVHARVPSSEVALGLDVVADVLAHPRFDQGELELERAVILEELRHAIDEPQRHLGRALFGEVFRRHPYRRPVLGSERSIERLTPEDLRAFHRQHFVASNIAVVVSGGFEPRAIRSHLDRHFGRVPAGRVVRRRAAEPPQTATRERTIARSVAEAQLVLAFPTPGIARREQLGLDLLSMALGQGESSRLHRRLERDRQLATSSGAYVHGFVDAGLFVATAAVASSDARDILACAEALAEESFQLGRELLDADELDKVARGIVADSVYGLETCDGAAAVLGSAWAHTGNASFEKTRARWAREARAADLRDIGRALIRPERATMAAMVPRDTRIGAGAFSALIHRASRSLAAAPKPTRRAPSAKHARKKPAAKTPVPTKTTRVALPGGATLVVHRDPSVPLVAAQATWAGGLRLESANNAGIGALLAASITRGCKGRDAAAVAEELDRSAMTMSGFSGRNSFGVRAEWLAADWDAGLALLFDCLLTPAFDDAEVVRERDRLIDDAATRETSPAHVAHRLFVETLYRRHPYRLDPLGHKASLTSLGATDVASFYRDHYPPSGMTLAIVGDVDPEAVRRAVSRRFAGVPAAARQPVTAIVETFDGRPETERERFAFLDRSQAHVVVGFPGASLADSDRHALEVLAAVLGGQGGRLFVSLREQRGIVYRVNAQSAEGVDPGVFAIVLACQPEHVATAIAEIRRQVDDLRSKPMPVAELARATAFLVGAHGSTLERRSALAAALAYQEAHGGSWRDVFAMPTTLRALSPAAVQAAARRYLRWDRVVTTTVLPPAQTPEVVRRARGSRSRVPASARRHRKK